MGLGLAYICMHAFGLLIRACLRAAVPSVAPAATILLECVFALVKHEYDDGASGSWWIYGYWGLIVCANRYAYMHTTTAEGPLAATTTLLLYQLPPQVPDVQRLKQMIASFFPSNWWLFKWSEHSREVFCLDSISLIWNPVKLGDSIWREGKEFLSLTGGSSAFMHWISNVFCDEARLVRLQKLVKRAGC